MGPQSGGMATGANPTEALARLKMTALFFPQIPPKNMVTMCPKVLKAPKAENLLKTKGKFSIFSLPKAENILKNKVLIGAMKKHIYRDFLSAL